MAKKSTLHDKCKLIMRDFTYDPDDIQIRLWDLEDSIMEQIGYDDRTLKKWKHILLRFGYIEKHKNQFGFKLGKIGMQMLYQQTNKKPIEKYGEEKNE